MHRRATGAGQNDFLHVEKLREKRRIDRPDAAFNQVEFASPFTAPIRNHSCNTLALKEASSGHRHWPKDLFICIKASLKAPY
jgi:hypothetical protein